MALGNGNSTAWPPRALRFTASVNSRYWTPVSKLGSGWPPMQHRVDEILFHRPGGFELRGNGQRVQFLFAPARAENFVAW